jgi:hypothetical protein
VTGTVAYPGAALRVRYREQQPLRADDLTAEQAHRLAQRRRHDSRQHRWGIVTGLALAAGPDSFRVQPGFATDGYGRGLVVAAPRPVPYDVFDRLKHDVADVWLLYHRAPVTPAARGRWDCGPGQHSRWDEEAVIRLATASGPVDARRPVEVPDSDLTASPEPPPDDPACEWPVYLGRVARVPATAGYSHQVDAGGRLYAGLMGEAVTSPAGRARIQVGADRAGDRRRFVVALDDAPGRFADRISIDNDGAVRLSGDAAIEGPLTVATRAGRACGTDFQPLAAVPKAAAPWRVYRAAFEQDGLAHDQMRFEIGHPGSKGDPSRYAFVIGAVDADGTFIPHLTTTADGITTINGDLRVEGVVVDGPVQADITDPRLATALLTTWLAASATANASLDQRYSGALEVKIESGTPVENRNFEYKIIISSVGKIALTGVDAWVGISVGGTVPQPVSVLDEPIVLAPGEQHQITRTFAIPANTADKALFIGATVLGIGPPNVTVQGSMSRTFKIDRGVIQ